MTMQLQYKLDKLYSILYRWLLQPAFLPYWILTLLILIIGYSLGRIFIKRKTSSDCDVNGRALAFAMTIAYYFLVYAYTVLSRPADEYWVIELAPFWSYYDVIVHHEETQLLFILINIAMLAPIGFLLPFWAEEDSGKNSLSIRRVLLIGAVLSYLIEFSQLLLHRGDFELFDDPFNNILGCLIGRWLAGKRKKKEILNHNDSKREA